MTLSARIAIGPSRRLARVEAAMLVGGAGLASTTGAMHWWPQHTPAIAFAMVCVACLAALVRYRMRLSKPPRDLSLSDRPTCEIAAPIGTISCTFGPETLVWPGFAVLALRPEGGRAAYLPAFDAELNPTAAWSLQRYLRWNQRMHALPVERVAR